MQIARSMTVAAKADHVWSILATDYAKVGEWARAVHASEPKDAGTPINGAPVTGRVCSASIGDVTETIRTFDPEQYILAYDAKAKAMPFFVRNLSGQWKLQSIGEATEVDLSFVADLMPPFGTLMGWAMRHQFSTAIDETLEDLKLYAETGKIHPAKAAALAA